MAAVLVRLKLTLLRRSFSGPNNRVAGVMLAAILVGLLTLVGLLALIGARALPVDQTRLWVVQGLAMITAGWLIAPLMVFGVDSTVDPSRFALLPLTARELQPGLFAAGLIGLPGAALGALTLGQIVTWSRSPLSLLGAIMGGALGVTICFLLSRVPTSAFSRALASRRMRDFAAVALGLLVVSLVLVNNVIGESARHDPEALQRVAAKSYEAIAWSPFGWAWSAPVDLATGRLAAGMTKLALAALLAIGLWLAWGRLLTRSLESIEQGETNSAVTASDRIDRLFPATPTGGVAARCLRYWRRDPRYLTSLVSLLIVPIALAFALRTSGVGALAAPVLLAAMFGPTLLTDLAYDNSAFWLHVSSGVPMRADRWGRVLALAAIIIPVMLVCLVGAAWLTGEWDDVIAALALCISFAGVSCGIACFAGAFYPGAAPPPGASPFAVKSGGGASVLVVLIGSWITTAALSLPVVLLVVMRLPVVALLVSVPLAGVVLILGVRWGAAQMERTAPELLARVTT